jgi:hypothetical protein
MNEYAKATEELAENLTKKHTKQIEALVRSNNEAMAKLAESLSKAPVIKASTDQNAKHKAWVEKCKTATKFPHCEKIHPNSTHAQCWELDINASKRPANWKSVNTVA